MTGWKTWPAAPLLAACVPPVPSAAPATGATEVQQVFFQVNAHRARQGCAPLVWSDAAARVAEFHSTDMRRRSYFSHTTPEGTQPWDRLRAQGIALSRAAENIAMVPGGAQAVRLWIDSPGHRANIESCSLTHTGIGVAGEYWTQLFYTPASR